MNQPQQNQNEAGQQNQNNQGQQRTTVYKDSKLSKYSKLVFFIFQLLFYGVIVYSFAYGNPDVLGQPYDIDHQPCGAGAAMSEYKYLYFVNPDFKDQLYRTICVKECPQVSDKSQETNDQLALQCHPNIKMASCDIKYSPQYPEYNVLYYDTISFINVCIPTQTRRLNAIKPALEKPFIVRFLSDLFHSQIEFISIFAFCLFCNFLIIYKIDDYPRFVMWLIVILGIIGSFINFGLGFIYYNNIISNSELNSKEKLTHEEVIYHLHAQYINIQPLQIITFSFAIIGVLWIILLIFKRKNISTYGRKAQIINSVFLVKLKKYSLNYNDNDENNPELPNYLQSILSIFVMLVIGMQIFLQFLLYLSLNLFSSADPKQDQNLQPFQYFQINTLVEGVSSLVVIQLIIVPICIIGIGKLLVINVIIEISKKLKNIILNQRQTLKINNIQENLDIEECLGKTIKQKFGYFLYGILYFIFGSYRSLIYMCQENHQKYSQSQQLQTEFDDSLKRAKRNHFHGFEYQLNTCFTISNLCISLLFLFQMYTPLGGLIHNPSFQISIVFGISFIITYLFTSLHGMSMDTLTVLMYQDSQRQGESYRNIGQHFPAQYRGIILENFSNVNNETVEFIEGNQQNNGF